MNMIFLSIGQAALLISGCTKTLRRWDEKGDLKADFRTKGNHRRYDGKKLFRIVGKREVRGFPRNATRVALYGRVSSSRQKKSGDLKRQLDTLKEHSTRRG